MPSGFFNQFFIDREIEGFLGKIDADFGTIEATGHKPLDPWEKKWRLRKSELYRLKRHLDKN